MTALNDIDTSLFFEQAAAEIAERDQVKAWMAEHLGNGGLVIESYSPDNCVAWSLTGTQRYVRGRPTHYGNRFHREDKGPVDPAHLAAKLSARSWRFGTTLTYTY